MLDLVELMIARDPGPASTLPYLILVPLGPGVRVLRTSGTGPREKALFCHPVPVDDWPAESEIVSVSLSARACAEARRSTSLLRRSREDRPKIVYTTARGRGAE